MWCTGKVDAYIKLRLYTSEVKECNDGSGRNIFLYPNQDLVLQPYMQAQRGWVGGENSQEDHDSSTTNYGLIGFVGTFALGTVAVLSLIAAP